MPRGEASSFQFIWCSIWTRGDSNFWVKICLALERSKMSFPPLTPYATINVMPEGGGGGAHGIVWGLFSVFGYPDETLFLVFDILHQP